MTEAEIIALWNIDNTTCEHADLYRFLLLSGQRIGEAQLCVGIDHGGTIVAQAILPA